MRGQELSPQQREQIIGAHLSGTKGIIIATQLNISSSTVYDTIKRYKKKNSPHPDTRPGRPKSFSERDKRLLQRHVRKNRFAPLGSISNDINTQLGTTFHANTFRSYLHEVGLESCVARKKPLLTKKQSLARLNWCKEKRNWDEEWKQITWSDESRFALFESDGRVRVWRRVGEDYNIDCIKPTVKFGGGSVMFWGCFSWNGIGPLVLVEQTMNSEAYVNVLATHFIPWVRNSPGVIFQQDGASCHTSLYTTWWLETHGIQVLDWVSQSPDLNPIENLWDHLDCQIRKRKPSPVSMQDLINAVQDEWAKISVEVVRNLILSLSRRVEAVIKAKGKNTKY
jgi:transposase